MSYLQIQVLAKHPEPYAGDRVTAWRLQAIQVNATFIIIQLFIILSLLELVPENNTVNLQLNATSVVLYYWVRFICLLLIP